MAGLPLWTEQSLPLLRLPLALEGQSLKTSFAPNGWQVLAVSLISWTPGLPYQDHHGLKTTGLDSMTKNLV